MTGPNVIRCPHWRKKNQRVMNRQPSTSISGKHRPENYGRGSTPSSLLDLTSIAPRSRKSFHFRSFPAAPRPTARPTQNDSDPFKDLGRARRHGRAADVPAAPAAPIWPTEADYPIVRSPVSFAATGQPMVLGHIQRRQL